MSQIPIESRPGYQETPAKESTLARELGLLARKHKILGCVLISFTRGRVAVNSSGVTPLAPCMDQLADRMLAAIDDGFFDPPTIPTLEQVHTGKTQ